MPQNNGSTDGIKQRAKEFSRGIRDDLIVGFIIALLVGLLEAAGLGIPSLKEYLESVNNLFLLIVSVVASAYISHLVRSWREIPPQYLTSILRELRDHHSSLARFAHRRALSHLYSLQDQFKKLTSSAGEQWTRQDRLNIASELFDSCGHISAYWATWTDPPYESTEAERRFLARQKGKLRKASVRRLVVFPEKDLIKNLSTKDHVNYIKAFLSLHAPSNFQLRYLPRSFSDLETLIREQLCKGFAEEVLVDFGIIDNLLVFGQQAGNPKADRPSGQGHIMVSGAVIDSYKSAFDCLWNRLPHDCYPGEQLSLFAHAMENRNTCIAGQTQTKYVTNKDFFADIVTKISCSKKLYAIDIAPDMSLWWARNEYLDFLNATIRAADGSRNGKHIRVYVLRRNFEDRHTAELFRKHVVLRQVEVGVELVFLTPSILIDHDLSVIDYIAGDSNWGFYLLPGDEFDYHKVTPQHNTISQNYLPLFQSIFQKLYDCSDPRQWRCKTAEDCNNHNFIEWLCNAVYT